MLDIEKLERFVLIAEKLIKIMPSVGVAALGYQTTGNLGGALFGMIALRLAQSQNLPASLAGTGALATLGITAMAGSQKEYSINPEVAAKEDIPYFNLFPTGGQF